MLTHACKRSGKCSFSSTPNASLIAFPIKLWAHKVSAGAMRRCCVCRSGLLHGPPGSGCSSSCTAGQAWYLSGHLLHVLRGTLPILVQTLDSPVFAAGRRASRWRMQRRPLGQGGWEGCSLLVLLLAGFSCTLFAYLTGRRASRWRMRRRLPRRRRRPTRRPRRRCVPLALQIQREQSKGFEDFAVWPCRLLVFFDAESRNGRGAAKIRAQHAGLINRHPARS